MTVARGMTPTMKTAIHIVALLLITGFLAACSSTVVKENPSSGTRTSHSTGKPGSTVRVQRGDTLYRIAVNNGISPMDLALWNRISAPYTIYPGQTLQLYPGSGSARPTTASSRPATPASGSASRPAQPPAPVAPPAGVPANSGFAWRWPADGQIVGRFVQGDASKQGIDIAGAAGQPVRAAADGVVVYSGSGLVGYGELIIVKHSETWLSAYGHNRKRLVNEGQTVKAGQQIAEMGRSGTSRDMLHFEIRYNGRPVDPLVYLPKR